MPSAEILAVLADEVTETGAAIGAALVRLGDASEEAAFQQAVAEYAECVQRIAGASEALSLAGLRRVCGFVEANLSALPTGPIDGERRVLLERWPQLVLGYLKAPRDGVYSRELTELFRRAPWPQPLDFDSARALEQELLALSDTDLEDPASIRATIAQPDDVALDIPDDMHPKLVDAFLTEGPLQAGEYSALLQQVLRGEGWVDELNECRRLIHGLKGAGNTVGVRGVATLCHHVEDILEYLVDNAVAPQGELARLLIKVADTLEVMFEALLGTGDVPADALQVLQAVLDWGNRIDRGEYDPTTDTNASADQARSAAVRPVASTISPLERNGAKSTEQVEAKVRVAVRTIDSLLRTSGELTISSGHVRERLQQAFKVLTELRERHTAFWDRSHDLEGFITTQGIAAGRRQAVVAASGGTASGLDALELDQYNELHTQVQGLTETAADLQMLSARVIEALTAVDTATNQQALLNDEMHELLMSSRMAPAGNLESRLQRALRQTAEQCGKQAALRLEGADVRLDDQMVNMLIDPLQHLLRNAVDHGLEAPAKRTQRGKPEVGTVVLTFSRDGNYLSISCRDDGAGLDLARIRAHAVSAGLINVDDILGDDEIARLILRPGFSTASAVTEVSGRGVGMDVVHTSVARLKGTMTIRTEAGQGTTFILRVPMSLGITHCLLTIAATQIFALPSDNLERVVYDGARHVQKTVAGWRYLDDDVTCPAYFLAQLAGYEQTESEDDTPRHVVLMHDVTGKSAIVVDAVTGGSDLVIKNTGRYLARVRGIVGASILGDGSVVPILDLPELLRREHGEADTTTQTITRPTVAAQADILVVDDSLSVRTALANLLTEEGFRVRTAKDGMEAIEAIDERLPAAVLADLEMPRMNGLELTTHIRTNAATRHLPVILVTSRTAEKHRNLAREAGVDDYLTKPYREHDLLLRLRSILTKAA